MITELDRSGWIGASDVQYVIGNWKTRTWEKWWLKKLGIDSSRFDNRYTMAGTHFEHRILESLHIPGLVLDRQIKNAELLLRVNLDGDTGDKIYECKTYKLCNGWKCPAKYIHQVQVQMYASGIKEAYIVAYGLEEADYDNFLRGIDPERIHKDLVLYDSRWVENVYLPKHRILADCLKRGSFPDV